METLILIIIFLMSISFVTGNSYQPRNFQGSPYSDLNPNFNGTNNQPGSNGAVQGISNNDEDSTSYEQNLSRENVTIYINNTRYDPYSLLTGNFTIGTSNGSEAGNQQNGSTIQNDYLTDSASVIANIDRNAYYDYGSSINATVYVLHDAAVGTGTALYQYRFAYYNSTNTTWSYDAWTDGSYQCPGGDGVWCNATGIGAISKIIGSNWGGGDDHYNYTFQVQVRISALDSWSDSSNVSAIAKNKTQQYRYKWVYSSDNGTSLTDGTDFTSWASIFIRKGTSNQITATQHTAEPHSNITHYGLFVEINGSDSWYRNLDIFNATRNATQSSLNLTQTAFTTGNTTYFPSTETSNTTLWFYGEIGYSYGADAKYYNGTGSPVNVSLYKPTLSGYSFIESKFPSLNENGSFQANFTLPARSQGGLWLIKTNYNSSDDVFPETNSFFTIKTIANETRVYGFYGENISASYSQQNTTNLQGEIRIETYFYNNIENFTPVCNATIQNKGTVNMTWNSTWNYCYNNTQAPASTGEKFIQTNFTINSSFGKTEDGFSSQNAIINVSDVLIINSTDADYNIYNKGENATHRGYIFNVRGEPLQDKTIQILLINSTNITQQGNSSVSLDGNGFFNITSFINSGNSSQHSTSGEPYRSRVVWNNNNGNSTEASFNVSSLLNITNTGSSYLLYNRGEETRHWGTIYSVDGNRLLNNKDITINLKDVNNQSVTNQTVTTDSSAIFNVTYTLLSTDSADYSTSGKQYIYDINDSYGNWINKTGSIFNVSSWWLVNVHTEIDSSRQNISSQVTFPNQNETGQASTGIIAADVLYIWGEVINIRNETLGNINVSLNLLRPDGTSAGSENQTTGGDGWTTSFYDKSTEAPSGTWTINGSASSNGNYGDEVDSISFISPYTGNIGKECYLLPQIGTPVPSNLWSINENVTLRCEFRKVENFVDTLIDTDNNETRFSIQKIELNGSQTTIFNNVLMNWFSTGKYDYNLTLNSSNGFMGSLAYVINGNAKIESRDILADSHFYIKDSELDNATLVDITNYPEVEAGNEYVAEISVKDGNGNYINADSTPSVTLIDPLGYISVGPTTSGVSNIETGRYNYTRATASSWTGGQWQILVNVSRGGNYYQDREYFKITSGPFDVRNITIDDSTTPSLQISVILENTGGSTKDMYVVWNLTRTDTNVLLGSGSDTLAVSGSSTRTYTITPSVSYVGEVKINFLGWYGTDFTERAGAYNTFTTTQESAAAETITSGGGGGSVAAPAITGKTIQEIGKIQLIDYPENIKIKPGESISKEIIIKNVGNDTLHNVQILILGLPLELYTISPKTIDIAPKDIGKFVFIISPIKTPQKYMFAFVVNAIEGTKEASSILIVEDEKEFREYKKFSLKEIALRVINSFSSVSKAVLNAKLSYLGWIIILIVLATLLVFFGKTAIIRIISKINKLIESLKILATKTPTVGGLINKEVYTDNGEYIGKIKDVLLRDSKIYGLKVKLKNKINGIFGVIIKNKDVSRYGKIVLVTHEVVDFINSTNLPEP